MTNRFVKNRKGVPDKYGVFTMVYGKGGVGKTSLFSKLPLDTTLFLDLEESTVGLDVTRYCDQDGNDVKFNTFSKIKSALKELRDSDDCFGMKVVVIETATVLEQLMIEDVLNFEYKSNPSAGRPTSLSDGRLAKFGAGTKMFEARVKEFINICKEIKSKHEIMVFLTAHESEIVEDEKSDGTPSIAKVSPAVGGKFWKLLEALLDNYMNIALDMKTMSYKDSFGKSVYKQVGKTGRKLNIRDIPGMTLKVRQSVKKDIPNSIKLGDEDEMYTRFFSIFKDSFTNLFFDEETKEKIKKVEKEVGKEQVSDSSVDDDEFDI